MMMHKQRAEPEKPFRLQAALRCGLCVASLILLTCCAPPTTVSLSERQAALAELEQAFAQTSADVSPAENASKVASAPADGGKEAPRGESRSLLGRIDAILAHQRDHRLMDTSVNAAWQIMHGVVCYGTDLTVQTPDRGLVGALDYAFQGGSIHGFEIGLGSQSLPSTGRTGMVARVEPGSYVGQGHPDQWLAICAMSQVPIETEVQVGGETRTLLDWSHQVQWDVVDNLMDEYSWTLIALTHYLPDEPVWTASNGTQVDWEALVSVELTHDLDSSPCGGTHRLAGLVRAIAAKDRLQLPDSAVWTEARQTIDRCIANAKQNRSADGSLSSYYFVRPSKSVDLAAELASAGHLFEFLALAVPTEELEQPWLRLAAIRICEGLERTQAVEMECGALYHALNGLKIYRSRCPSL